MNKVEADVRAGRDEIALETVKLDQQAAWRKLCDQWRDEPRSQAEPHEEDELDEPDEPCKQDESCEVPEQKFRYDCWDEPDPLVVGPTNLPRLSLPEAAVRLAILHDHVYNDGLFEPILSNEWYDSLGPLWQVGVICWRRRMDKLDEYEVRVLQRCLIILQGALGARAAVPATEGDANEVSDDKPVLTVHVTDMVATLGGEQCKFEQSFQWEAFKKMARHPGRAVSMSAGQATRLRNILRPKLPTVATTKAIYCAYKGGYAICTADFLPNVVEPPPTVEN